MVANGVVISKFCYLIQLWGGAEAYLLKSLQVLQNRAGIYTGEQPNIQVNRCNTGIQAHILVNRHIYR